MFSLNVKFGILNMFCLSCVYSDLRVTKPLKNIEVPETHVATFECEVSHFNVPSIWLKNGDEIEMSEKFGIVVQGKLHQLKVMNTSQEDASEYAFVCGNDSVSATLTVKREYYVVCKLKRNIKLLSAAYSQMHFKNF